MSRVLARLGEGGRLVIPAEYRKALGVDVGDELVLVLEEGSVRVSTPQEAIRDRCQANPKLLKNSYLGQVRLW